MAFFQTGKKKAIKPTDKQNPAHSSLPVKLTLHYALRNINPDRVLFTIPEAASFLWVFGFFFFSSPSFLFPFPAGCT